MRHLLIDLDSVIPNLAIMQLSSWLKARGEEVRFRSSPEVPDAVWISCVFTWNAPRARGVARLWEAAGAKVRLGGTGVDFVAENGRLRQVRDSRLPPGAELLVPDYSLYPGDDRAVGFAARGCDRSCEFCVVPLKEGKIGEAAPIAPWVGDRKKVLLLDNDLPLGPHHDAVLREVLDHGWKLSITQGYDLRCLARGQVSGEGLAMLAEVKPWDVKFRDRRLYVAWDYQGIEPYVRRGLEMLLDAGFKPREVMCYILCGFNTTHAEDYHRYEVLWEEFGVYPFVMVYNNRRDDPLLRAFSRWVNRRIHKVAPFESYSRLPEGVLA
ncbi:MAG: hypothetical protein V3U45_03720 [bacterium]